MNISTETDKWRAVNDTYAYAVKTLTEARKAKGWSRYWLALQTNLSIPTITKFEDNETRASFETILIIAHALDVNINIQNNGSAER